MSRDLPGGAGAGSAARPTEELAKLAADGAQDALTELLGQNGQDVYRFCVALAGTKSGEELLDRTLKRAARGIRSGTRGLAVAPWLFSKAREEAEASGPPAAEPRARGLMRRFQELSRTERGSLVMAEVSDFTYGTIADVLHISSTQAQKLVTDARTAIVGSMPRPTPECEIVQAALLRDELPPLGRQAVERHISRCAYCQRVRDGVATLPGLLKRSLPKLAPVILTAMIQAAVAHASVGGAGDAPDKGARDDDHAARDAYRRRRSIAASAVLALLVIVAALALSTGRLKPDLAPGPPAAAPFILPQAFFHLTAGDVGPGRPNGHTRPFVCGAASCPPPLPGPPPNGCTRPPCHALPPPPPPPPVPPHRRCPNGTIEPDCKRPPHRCRSGTIEPHCTPPPRRCARGTVEPDCHRPPTPCPRGTIEPDCQPPRPPCPDGTVEPDCQPPQPPCPDGKVEPDCHIPPPPPPPCTGPDCGHDFQPLPELCHHHHGHHEQQHAHDASPPAAVAPDPPADPVPPVDPAPAPAPDPQPAADAPPNDPPASNQTQQQTQPAPAPEPQQPEPQQPPEQPQPQPEQPQQPPEEPQPQPDQQPGNDQQQQQPPDRQHHDGGVQTQWAVESRARNRSRRFSVL